MESLITVYLPVGVGTFHMETAADQFARSVRLLKSIDGDVVVPDKPLLSVEALRDFLAPLRPGLVIFQDLTFANGAYMAEVLRRYDGPVLLWTLREPAGDGGRLKLNSLTGAYSAAHTLRNFGNRPFSYVFGAPEEENVREAVRKAIRAAADECVTSLLDEKPEEREKTPEEVFAASIRDKMRSLKIAAVGHTPQGFGFGRALDAEMMHNFGAELVSVEVRELINKAKSYADEECAEYLARTEEATCGFGKTPEKNRLDHARLYKAYTDFVRENGIGALASRCWPDLFTEFGTPVCTVLSLLNDEGVAAACEADLYGALSMWIGQELSGRPVFFGDPVALDEEEKTLTFWHCGMAACSLARRDTGAAVGVHPNRKIGPAMDFGCESFPSATIFRIGREPDGSFRFFIAEGEALDRPKQFIGTSLVVRTDADSRALVEQSVAAGFEPHFAVIHGRHAGTLKALAGLYGFKVCEYPLPEEGDRQN